MGLFGIKEDPITTKRRRMYQARFMSAITPKDKLGHAYDYLRVVLKNVSPEAQQRIAQELYDLADAANSR